MCWRRVQPFTRSVGRLLDRGRNYLRQAREVKGNRKPSFRGARALARANPESRSFYLWIPGSREDARPGKTIKQAPNPIKSP
jgi:hypothetical protein